MSNTKETDTKRRRRYRGREKRERKEGEKREKRNEKRDKIDSEGERKIARRKVRRFYCSLAVPLMKLHPIKNHDIVTTFITIPSLGYR